jgi:uncharacterized protein (DUF952 family)
MRLIYHLVPRDAWERNRAEYRPDSLDAEGFIHCSNAGQVAWAANTFYPRQPDLLVLAIDTTRLTSPLRDEPGGDSGELFPHVHGPINPDAVVAVRPLTRDAEGRWTFNE